MKASDISAVSDMLQRLAQLRSRLTQVSGAASLTDLLALLSGTGLEAGVLAQAKDAVTGFLHDGPNGITALEAQIAALGVEVDV